MIDAPAKHPFEVVHYEAYGEHVEIDVEIVPLIRLLWAHGLDTFNSCQDYHDMVWIEFDGPSATEFLHVVASHDDALRGCALHSVPCEVDSPEMFDAWTRDHGWTYSALPWPGWGDDPEHIRFLVSVHFPRHQLDAVVAALREVGHPDLAGCLEARQLEQARRGISCNIRRVERN